jgi:hypothetical protein
VSTNITTNKQVDKVIQPNSIGMFVEYEAPWFVCEGGIDPTQLDDVEYGFLLTLDYYKEGTRIKYSSKHEDSMEE